MSILQQQEEDYSELAEKTRVEMNSEHTLEFEADFGDAFFNSLFWGTLKTLADRVDDTGFCQTSYGECGGVKCYGVTHYPRDSAEASCVLTRVGLLEKAEAILDFTLHNIPAGQRYIPHVYAPGGKVHANTIQVDTPGLVSIALGTLAERTGPSDGIKTKYDIMLRISGWMWEKHFHDRWNLLDAGNYNEQFDGGSMAICDIFTNSAFYAGLESMEKLANMFGDSSSAELCAERRNSIAKGIESNFFNDSKGIYHSFINPDGEKVGGLDWHCLYSNRWYPLRDDVLENMFQICRKETTIRAGKFNVINCEMNQQHRVLGKIFAWVLGYLARTRKWTLLREHLEFARQMIRRPANVFPEWWYLRREVDPPLYWKKFWNTYAEIWTPYNEMPDGDYTVDSGNCEQCSVFLSYMLKDLLPLNFSSV